MTMPGNFFASSFASTHNGFPFPADGFRSPSIQPGRVLTMRSNCLPWAALLRSRFSLRICPKFLEAGFSQITAFFVPAASVYATGHEGRIVPVNPQTLTRMNL